MHGMIAWFARNGVAANLLMFLIVFSGLYSVTQKIPLEVFPSFELDFVNINVGFRGATPSEVEEGVAIRIEEAIADMEGIKSLSSRSSEGSGSVTVEVAGGYDSRRLMEDIKSRVDSISTFPADIERPVVSIPQRSREVISVALAGDVGEKALRVLGERLRDDLLALPQISQIEFEGVRDYEIGIEVSEQNLRRYGLTLDQVAAAVRQASLDLSAGSIKTAGGEVLIRTMGQAYRQADFERIVVLTRADGTRLTVADIATVVDGFEEDAVVARFNGKPAVMIEVYRVGDQSAIEVADAVKGYIDAAASKLPPGVTMNYWRDRSRIVKARIATLTNSAVQGGILILLLLTLFLRFSVALWVFLGVPVSFMGGLALMPSLGVTINIVSLFGFILVLGIVVDDAIVTGENIYRHLKLTGDGKKAAIEGTQEVAVPVTFGVLTTVVAFIPLFMIEGVRGQIFSQIPIVVVPVLLFSLVESKLILPSHLSHLHIKGDDDSKHNFLVRIQRKIANGLELAIEKVYQPVLSAALRQRYLTLSVFIGVTVIVFSLVMSGHMRFVFFPRVQSETARVSLSMAAGTPFEATAAQVERITRAAEELRKEFVEPDGRSLIKDVMSQTGISGESHRGRVIFEILSPEDRTSKITSSEILREWRKKIGSVPGAKDISYRAEIGRGGDPIDVQISGDEFGPMTEIAAQIKDALRKYPGVFDITDSFEDGKEELQLSIKPEAQLLGLSLDDLATQVRQAFFGFEVQRIQRGREDVRVMVRYPQSERRSLENLENMRIRTPEGVEVPFGEVAEALPGRSYSVVSRIDRKRTMNVIADVNKETANIEAIKRDINALIDEIGPSYPGVTMSLEGEAKEQRESFGSLRWGSVMVLFAIYALLAIPFKSYFQPLIVMTVIPFGLVGAVIGHYIMGMNLSLISGLGMLALTGVVVNDSLVLVDYVNRKRKEGISLEDAARMAGVARFRPVLLTSLTTFAGLIPLIFEKSTQAQFLIPMAVSLGFGILFATFITLLLIPINYLIFEDVGRWSRRIFQFVFGPVIRLYRT